MMRFTTKTLLWASCYLLVAISNWAYASGGGPEIPECAAINYSEPNVGNAPLKVDGQYLKDNNGRVVLLRGVNTSGNSKVPDFMPLDNSMHLDPLPAWGINTLRLLFTWEAFEPVRCQHSSEYLDYYERVVEWANERGIYVIVDFHQDAYSRFNVGGCGEGAPEWAVTSKITKNTPDNTEEKCSGWGPAMIFDLDHHKTWEEFHHDTELAKTRYLDMVEAVAERMSSHTNVIGYELINEPWGFDDELYNLFEAVGAKIRERHPDAILFVPPHALVSGGTSSNNIAEQSFDNKVYSPHFYDANVILSNSYGGNDISGTLNDRLAEADNWGVPVLLSEYGAPGTTENGASYMEALYDWMDSNFISGTQWNYTPGWTPSEKDGWNGEDLSIVNDMGQLNENIFITRPYPAKTSGTPVNFERLANGLTYTWNNDPALGETELYLPAAYADGKSLQVTPGGSAGCDINGTALRCSLSVTGEVTLSLQ